MSTIPCPTIERQLRVATIEANAVAICPSCATHGHGGYFSFDATFEWPTRARRGFARCP